MTETMAFPDPDTEPLEIDLLLEAIYRRYGYDFRQYARASITRRIRHHIVQAGARTVADLIPMVIHDRAAFEALVLSLSITVTEMFRDPGFYRALRDRVIPFLKTFPFINVWHAGCATGQEAYSLAILLLEEGLYDRCRIYATDYNDSALKAARERIYPLDKMQGYNSAYLRAGGKRSLADYYQTGYDSAILSPVLSEAITFANHNLVTDGVFADMHLILCRNVLIYFDRPLQERTLGLLRDSLCHQGFLCLGSKETLQFSPVRGDFVVIDAEHRIYQYKQRQQRA